MLASQVVYSLNARTGLSVEIASQNIGTVTAPYGVGIHPYLTCNLTSVDEYLFQLPANQFMPSMSTLIRQRFTTLMSWI